MYTVNGKRLRTDLESLSEIGRVDGQGIFRMAYSDADMAARRWLSERITEADLEAHQDGVGNVYARYGTERNVPSVMTGSHIDTVPGAGHLDGALGVIAGLECLRTLKEAGAVLRHPVESVAFADEEGRFGNMMGSQAVCGQLTPESLHKARDLAGVRLEDEMARHGLRMMDVLHAARSPDSVAAFIELHIEQGPVLDRKRVHVGVVDAIAGLFKWQVRFIGEANHAGTTPMDMRRDAFLAVAEVANGLPRVLEEYGSPRSVATIGRVELTPGTANVVPGVATFSLEVRDTDADVLLKLADAFRRMMSAIARRRDLMFEFDVMGELAPVRCDPGLVEMLDRVSREMGVNSLRMHSGAAHDTQIMSSLARAAMIFVPSKEGRSHSPAEWTSWEDIELGTNVLLNTLVQLAGEESA